MSGLSVATWVQVLLYFMNWMFSNMLGRLILSICCWNLICHLGVKTLKLKLEGIEGGLLKRVDMVFLLLYSTDLS